MTDQLIYRKQMLKAPQVAEILNISRAFAYKLINQGDIPSVKIGKSVRVRQEDLEAFIEQSSSDIFC